MDAGEVKRRVVDLMIDDGDEFMQLPTLTLPAACQLEACGVAGRRSGDAWIHSIWGGTTTWPPADKHTYLPSWLHLP